MVDFEIVQRLGTDAEKRYYISPEGLVIGRSPEAAINLTDQLVSRRHARIWLEEDHPVIEDLGSRNGVLVNGRKVQRTTLHDMDKIVIGEVTFHIAKASGVFEGQAVISSEKAAALHASMINEPSNPRLPVLYRAAQLMGSVFDLDDLLNQILGLIFEALPVRRGYIITMVPQTQEIEIHATRSLENGNTNAPLSNTLIHHVFAHKEAILILDAQADSRFELAESIMSHEIHSAMCAPLRGREDVVGAIYVDSGAQSLRFSNADLELLTAIAWVVGVAVENARLYRENVQRERMAAIGQATAGLGHCIKNILTGIRGSGEIITRALDEKNWEYLEKGWTILSRSVERIDMLVMNMLTYSKEREPQRSLSNVNALVTEVLMAMQSRAARYHVELECPEQDPIYINIDHRHIYRVILNLVVNGIEACESKGGRVVVQIAPETDGCRIKVADTGSGIPEEIRPKLFQAFVSSKGSSGTGLGLASAMKIVQEHGGKLEVIDEPGFGAVFQVFLPNVAS